jgi:hypothetical protein
MIEYKGHTGVFEFDPSIDAFHGRVVGLQDVLTFQGSSLDELRREMENDGSAGGAPPSAVDTNRRSGRRLLDRGHGAPLRRVGAARAGLSAGSKGVRWHQSATPANVHLAPGRSPQSPSTLPPCKRLLAAFVSLLLFHIPPRCTIAPPPRRLIFPQYHPSRVGNSGRLRCPCGSSPRSRPGGSEEPRWPGG